MRRSLTLCAALALVLAGCGSEPADEDPDASTAAEEDGGGQGSADGDEGASGDVAGTITIADFAYGDPLTVAPEGLVEVVNEDSARHDVDALDGTSFNTDLLGQGEMLTFNAPAETGSYDFTCSVHPQMAGELIVAE